MVNGVLVCGTFLTKRALIVIASITMLVLLLGIISLTVGLLMFCPHGSFSYYDSCSNIKLSLVINGGVLMGFTVIGLIVIAVLACRVKEAPVVMQPTVVTQPYMVMPVYGQGTSGYPNHGAYSLAAQGQPQQHQPQATASTSDPEKGPRSGHDPAPKTDTESASCSAQYSAP